MNQKAERIIPVCNVCQEIEHVVHCRACGLPVCPRHRAGLGELSDGYSCTETGTCMLFGFGGTPAPAAEASHVHERPYVAAHWEVVLIGIIVGLVLIAIGYVMAQAWHDF